MKALMKENLIMRYQQCEAFDYRGSTMHSSKNELLAVKENSWLEYIATKEFLKSIEGKVVELVFTCGDAFEKEDDNYWLPSSLWDEVIGEDDE